MKEPEITILYCDSFLSEIFFSFYLIFPIWTIKYSNWFSSYFLYFYFVYSFAWEAIPKSESFYINSKLSSFYS